MIFNTLMFLYICMMLVASCHVFEKCGNNKRGYILSALTLVVGMVPAYLANHWWGY